MNRYLSVLLAATVASGAQLYADKCSYEGASCYRETTQCSGCAQRDQTCVDKCTNAHSTGTDPWRECVGKCACTKEYSFGDWPGQSQCSYSGGTPYSR